MKRYIQHEFLKVHHFISAEWEHPVHNHNHFEMIFIHRGKGIHSLSGATYLYDGPALFLLTPSDYHSFVIEEETEFTFLKFTNVYLDKVENIQAHNYWYKQLDELLIHAKRNRFPLLKSKADMEKTNALMRLIVSEWEQSFDQNNETLFILIQAVFSILKRNIPSIIPNPEHKQCDKITKMVHYIHNNIFCAERTHLNHLADTFSYSKHYIGIFFKEQTGVTLREYVNSYKVKLIENRLQYSSLSIKEISQEMGFTDLSHFNKYFKNYNTISPSVYRKQVKEKAQTITASV